jgi:hypothetical protein
MSPEVGTFRTWRDVRLESAIKQDIVANVFLGCRTKILRTADAFYAWRREGPYRFIQNRPRTFLAALKSYGAAEKSKDQLLRDFWGCSIFDFCNTIKQESGHRLKRKSRQKAALQFNPDAGNLCLLTMHQLADDCGCAGWAHWIRLTFELF